MFSSSKGIGSYFSFFNTNTAPKFDPVHVTLFHAKIPKGTVFFRVDERKPTELGNGFVGREQLQEFNMGSYIAFNKKMNVWGGTICPNAAMAFSKNGSANDGAKNPNIVYVSIPENDMHSVPRYIFDNVDAMSEPHIYKKSSELEVVVVNSIVIDRICYACDSTQFEKLQKGEEVENLMCDVNPNLPKTFKLSDVHTANSILKHMIKFGCKQAIIHGINTGMFQLNADCVAAAKELKQPELVDTLTQMLDSQRLSNGLRS